MSPERERVLAAARALLGVREIPRGSNRGPAIEAMLRLTGLGPGEPWCAAYVAWVGQAALSEAWPLPLTASCERLHRAAEGRGWLTERPEAGDVFLLWFPRLGRFAHTGFVELLARDGGTQTIEGNTNGGGSRDGWGCFARARRFGAQDRFIRWAL